MGIPGRKPNPKKKAGQKGGPTDVSSTSDQVVEEGDVDTSCPKWLDRWGKEFWKQHVPRLTAKGLFLTIDRPAFEIMADCYSQFRQAQRFIKQNGMTFVTPNGYIQQRPEVGIANKAKEQLRLYYAEFGMTASSRTRIMGEGDGSGEGEDEDWSGTGLDR